MEEEQRRRDGAVLHTIVLCEKLGPPSKCVPPCRGGRRERWQEWRDGWVSCC